MPRFHASCLLVYLLVSAYSVHAIYMTQASVDTREFDVYYSWLEEHRLVAGENPYARVLEGDMRANQKYATYLPGFYLMAAALEKTGVSDYDAFLRIWRPAHEALYLAVGFLLLVALYRPAGVLMAIVGSSLWFFGRWSLTVVTLAHLEPLAIFFLVAGWMVYRRHRWAGLVLFGTSLAVKQIAIFLVPALLIATWHAHIQAGFRTAVRATLASLVAMAAIPLLLSVPFMAWNFKGFVKSILFSATRSGGSHFYLSNSADILAGLQGLFARLPMLAVMGIVYLILAQRRIGLNVAALLVMTIFIEFNSVLFVQYMCWTSPLFLFVVAEATAKLKRGIPVFSGPMSS